MKHAENNTIWSKIKEKLRKYSFFGCLLLAGVVFFTWTDNWKIYAEPLRQMYEQGTELMQGQQPALEGGPETSVTGEEIVNDTPVPAEEEMAVPETETVAEPAQTQDQQEGPKEVVYHTVDDSYFDDAVFIGDSRTVGMYEYSGLEQTSTFYASTGLTIYKMFDSAIVSVPGQKKKITVEEALSEKQFAKIYLMIGINEMGTGTVESFMKAYGEAVQHLQQLQPDAVIYLQAIMKVTTERSGQGDYITNEGIEARNEEIAKLADDEKIFYLDVNPLICDETGGMVASYTYDGVHLKAQYIPIWLDFLKQHAVE